MALRNAFKIGFFALIAPATFVVATRFPGTELDHALTTVAVSFFLLLGYSLYRYRTDPR